MLEFLVFFCEPDGQNAGDLKDFLCTTQSKSWSCKILLCFCEPNSSNYEVFLCTTRSKCWNMHGQKAGFSRVCCESKYWILEFFATCTLKMLEIRVFLCEFNHQNAGISRILCELNGQKRSAVVLLTRWPIATDGSDWWPF